MKSSCWGRNLSLLGEANNTFSVLPRLISIYRSVMKARDYNLKPDQNSEEGDRFVSPLSSGLS
jgi:hypothetical protein